MVIAAVDALIIAGLPGTEPLFAPTADAAQPVLAVQDPNVPLAADVSAPLAEPRESDTETLIAPAPVTASPLAVAALAVHGVLAQEVVEVRRRARAADAAIDRGVQRFVVEEHDGRRHLLLPLAMKVAQHVGLTRRRGLMPFGVGGGIRAAETLLAARAERRGEQGAEAITWVARLMCVAEVTCVRGHRGIA